jgi:hypothetical protein
LLRGESADGGERVAIAIMARQNGFSDDVTKADIYWFKV